MGGSDHQKHGSSNSETSSDQETSNCMRPPTSDGGSFKDHGSLGRSYYECTFCKRGFNNAQALGGHMNIHRKHKLLAAKGSTKHVVDASSSSAKSNKHNHSIGSSSDQSFGLIGSSNFGFHTTTGGSTTDHHHHRLFTVPSSNPNFHWSLAAATAASQIDNINNNDHAHLQEEEEEDLRVNLNLRIGTSSSSSEIGNISNNILGFTNNIRQEDWYCHDQIDEIDLELRLGSHYP